jgi:hypothetical protein
LINGGKITETLQKHPPTESNKVATAEYQMEVEKKRAGHFGFGNESKDIKEEQELSIKERISNIRRLRNRQQKNLEKEK